MGALSRALKGGRGMSAAALTFSLLVVACIPQGGFDNGEAVGGSPQEAAEVVDVWLARARSGEGDAGWSLLHPSTQTDVIGGLDAYRDQVRKAAWNDFTYEIQAVRIKDGTYRVSVHVDGGEANVPGFMRDWRLIEFVPLDGRATEEGEVTVEIAPDGAERGIVGGS